jgi:hypothetical protein
MEPMETKVQELQTETLPTAPENTTTTDRPVPDDERRTIAAVLKREVQKLRTGERT